MKLYGKISSERATKGQGGNDYLDIVINDENKENLCRLYAENWENDIVITFHDYENSEKYVLHKPKVKKQKAEHECEECEICPRCLIYKPECEC